ncbi:hypothetical protein ACHAQH_003377 [Verticillium albo-atrum]
MTAGNKPWADGPFQLVSNSKLKLKEGEKANGAREMAWEMTIIHNILLRIINSIYVQCVNVGTRGTQQDIDDFVNYASLWHKAVTHHHHTEETMIFPDIERMAGVPGLMEANVAQHEAFHHGLEEYKTYLDSVQAAEEKYNGAKLKGIIDSFAGVLQQHLADEIDTLVKLDEEHADKAEWDVWYKKTMDIILKATKDPEHAVQSEATTTFGRELKKKKKSGERDGGSHTLISKAQGECESRRVQARPMYVIKHWKVGEASNDNG